jgi:hypothetical protein
MIAGDDADAANVERTTTVKMDAATASPAEEFCAGLPGSTPPFKDFDPWNWLDGKSKAEIYRWRESEIAHARLGMLGAAGILLQELTPTAMPNAPASAIDQWAATDGGTKLTMFAFAHLAEVYRARKKWDNPFRTIEVMSEDEVPGDLGFDPLRLYPKDPQGRIDMQNRELNNGRLAMLAAAGIMVQEGMNHKPFFAPF